MATLEENLSPQKNSPNLNALARIEESLKHRFKRSELLRQALTHSSFYNEQNEEGAVSPTEDNERLEFLGDAVIGLVMAQSLMDRFGTACEGKLSRWRSQLVSRKTLAEIASQLGMGEWVLLGRGERRTGGAEKVSILAGVFEAVVGALYLDGGIQVAERFLADTYEAWIHKLSLMDDGESRKMYDMKTHLQEKTQGMYRSTPTYRLMESWGPEHDKVFKVVVEVQGKALAQGEGKSKKEAEQRAAQIALEMMGF